MTTHTTDKLADFIVKRHRCLSQLRDLGRKQADLISASEMSAVLRLIAVKNQLIVALQAIEQQLAPYHAQEPESRQWASSEKRAESAALAKACSQLLEEVMQLERDNEKKMTQRRDQVAGQLQAAQAASTARGAYQAQQRSEPKVPASNAAISPNTSNDSYRLDLHSEA